MGQVSANDFVNYDFGVPLGALLRIFETQLLYAGFDEVMFAFRSVFKSFVAFPYFYALNTVPNGSNIILKNY
jgi:hypothetical protein